MLGEIYLRSIAISGTTRINVVKFLENVLSEEKIKESNKYKIKAISRLKEIYVQLDEYYSPSDSVICNSQRRIKSIIPILRSSTNNMHDRMALKAIIANYEDTKKYVPDGIMNQIRVALKASLKNPSDYGS